MTFRLMLNTRRKVHELLNLDRFQQPTYGPRVALSHRTVGRLSMGRGARLIRLPGRGTLACQELFRAAPHVRLLVNLQAP